MNLAAIPQNRQRTAKLGFEMPQVSDNVFGMGINVLRQQLKIQVQPAVARTDRDAADSGDPITPVPSIENGRLAAGRPGTPYGWRKHVAGFIEKNQVRAPLPGFPDDARKLLLFPAGNFAFVAFAGPATRFLHGPAKPFAEEAAHMI